LIILVSAGVASSRSVAAGRVFYPHHQAVGDFHSHPFDDLTALRENRGWTYTREDEQANMEFSAAMAELGHRIEVALVVCIARGGKTPAGRHFRGEKNTYQLAVDQCRVVVVAYRSLGSGRLSRANTRLCIAGRGG
jgi:hypothetical protein